MQADGYGQAWSDTTGYKGGYGIGVPASDSVVQAQQHISWEQARKVMPLAALDVGSGHRVFFGLYVGADDDGPVGSPLPGGLPTALTCGIFALGFWYVRRRKAVAA